MSTKFLLLKDASTDRKSADGKMIEVVVNLDTEPVRCRRVWIPKKHIQDLGPGQVLVTEWMVKQKNIQIKKEGEKVGIQIEEDKVFFLEMC